LLVPNSLPRGTDEHKLQFRRQYDEVYKPGGKPIAYDPQKPIRNLRDEVLKAANPATPEEIAAAKTSLWNTKYAPMITTTNGIPTNQNEVAAAYNKEIENFEKSFREGRAKNYKLYVDPPALAPMPSLAPNIPSPPLNEDIWYGQMRYWIH